jgi:hypothetical protein
LAALKAPFANVRLRMTSVGRQVLGISLSKSSFRIVSKGKRHGRGPLAYNIERILRLPQDQHGFPRYLIAGCDRRRLPIELHDWLSFCATRMRSHWDRGFSGPSARDES